MKLGSKAQWPSRCYLAVTCTTTLRGLGGKETPLFLAVNCIVILRLGSSSPSHYSYYPGSPTNCYRYLTTVVSGVKRPGRGVDHPPIRRQGNSKGILRGDFYLRLNWDGKVKLSSCLISITQWKHTEELRHSVTVLFVILVLDGEMWWTHAPSAWTPQKGTR